jgi:N-acetylneuraminic acid mutarotase
MRIPKTPTQTLANPAICRNILSILFLSLLFTTSNAQTSQWTWMSGDNTSNPAGVYGTKGTAAATNRPSARIYHSGWKTAGYFWVFGGYHSSGYRNDLWKYNLTTNQWTWMSGDNTTNQAGVYGTKGTAAATNKPGSRSGQTAWTDASGNFWIFGGYGYDRLGNIGCLNDLWKYDPATGQWTWISGDDAFDNSGVYGTKGTAAATNKPSGRFLMAGWTDASGNFWIFGGRGFDAAGLLGFLNDLWKYSPGTGQWTWVSGDNTRNILGVYGTKGTAAAANKPGSRNSHSGWTDAAGNFWIFGGDGFDLSNPDYLNDLWKYNPITNQWTWISGDNTTNQSGIYGTKGTAAAANKPGARYGHNTVVDALGIFWVFAGRAFDGAGATGSMNDLWQYNPSTGQWTWISGDNTVDNVGVYGTKGTAAATNKPGARYLTVSWMDAAGNFWNFGGSGSVNFNDLWKFGSFTTLPTHQISLHGTSHNGNNFLNWKTTGEENTKQFIVERSTN